MNEPEAAAAKKRQKSRVEQELSKLSKRTQTKGGDERDARNQRQAESQTQTHGQRADRGRIERENGEDNRNKLRLDTKPSRISLFVDGISSASHHCE